MHRAALTKAWRSSPSGVDDPTSERLDPRDVAELDWESPLAPMNIAAILQTGTEIDHDGLRRALAERVGAVPRLRQLVQRSPGRRRRSVWTPDPRFAIEDHVSTASCPPPGDENALLALAAAEASALLPRNRPLWRAVHVTGLRNGGGALILVLHHAVADGLGSLAVLGQLVDAPTRRPPTESGTGDEPSHPGSSAPQDPDDVSVRELLPSRHRRRPVRALNTPIGAHRRLAVTTVPLGPLITAAHRASATVNDLVLVSVGDALRAVLEAEGQDLGSVVVSVPVSQRPATATGELGNRVGVMPVRVPCTGPLARRLVDVAATTRRRRPAAHRGDRLGVSLVTTGPVFSLLSRLGLFQWFIAHQRLVNTFVTNLHGPAQQLTLLGAPIIAMTPFSPIAGNVTVAFTAFSYAGTLSVTVVADADRWPDATPIATALGRALAALTAPAG